MDSQFNYISLFESLFSNLYESKLIYNERGTFICEMLNYKIQETRFVVELKAIKPIIYIKNNSKAAYNESMICMPSFKLIATYIFGDYNIYDGKRIGRPYCPFSLWVDKLFVQKIIELDCENNEDEIWNLLWYQQ